MADHYDDVSQQAEQMTDQAKALAGKAASTAGKQALKVAGKVGKKVAAKSALLAVKGIGAVISAIVSLGVPLLIFLAVMAGLVGFSVLVEIDSRSINQNFQSEEPSQMNTQEVTSEKSEGEVADLSTYNLVVNAFYMNYASQSYYRFYEGELIEPGESQLVQATAKRSNNKTVKEPEKKELKDSTDLESQFLLSHSLLWELDEYLHKNKFKYPESFIKPLYYEEVTVDGETTFEVKDLTDEHGNLVAQSHVYDEDGKRTDELTEGVWDYGLAPIISYKTYLKDNRYEYDVTGKSYEYSYTLPAGAVEGTITHSGSKTSTLTEADLTANKKEDEYLEGYEFIHMIDKVTTFVGTFTPQIEYQWSRDAGVVETFQEKTKDKKKSKKYDITFEKWVPQTTSTGLQLYSVTADGQWAGTVAETCYRINRDDPDYAYVMINTCTGNQVVAKSQQPIKVTALQTKKMVTEAIEVEVTEVITYEKYLATVTPQYRGEPQVTEFKGGSYLRDYLAYYETYVPDTVMTDLDLSNRVSEDPEKLQEIIDAYQATQSSGAITLEGGKEVGKYYQSSFDNANRYLDLFKEYGEIYGVDPYLLLAKAAQESSGDHHSNLTGSNAIGVMQIERPGQTDGSGVAQVTAFNHNTQKTEVVKVCKGNSSSPSGCVNVYDLENNIRVGAMQLAQRYKVFNGHHMLALQSYNFGEGGTRTTVKTCGADYKQVMKDQYDLDWMACRQTIHENPSLVKRPDLKTYGDPVYVENVLKYYQNPETGDQLIYKDEKGTTHQFDTTKIKIEGSGGALFSTSSANSGALSGLSQLGKFFKLQFNNIVATVGSLFHDAPKHFGLPEKDTKHFDSNLSPLDLTTLEKMIFAIEDQVSINNVGEITDEVWKERYSSVFAGLSTHEGAEFTDAHDPYFKGGARTPLPFEMSPIVAYSYRSMINGQHNYGVAYAVVPNTAIHAIYDGTVLSIKNENTFKKFTVTIQHHNGLVSSYGNLDEKSVSLKVGDAVRRGDVIGKVAAVGNSSQQFFSFELRQDGVPVNPTFLFKANGSGGDYFIPESDGTFIIPLVKGIVTCEWACYVDKNGRAHYGIDLADGRSLTTPIVASASGTVVTAGWNDGGYGYYVMIDHKISGKVYRTVYAHMSQRPMVSKGQIVEQGQQLGMQGSTGNSTGPHLHFEIREGGTTSAAAVNPRKYINFPKSWDFTK